jgi:predicted nucleic acid-binding protein
VIDSSALVEYLIGTDLIAEHVRARCMGEYVYSPHAIDLECASSFRGMVLGKKLPAEEGRRALRTLARMPIRRVEHGRLIPRIWKLRENMWPYDAAYVALAERLGAELVTTDGKFARTPGLRCVVNQIREG